MKNQSFLPLWPVTFTALSSCLILACSGGEGDDGANFDDDMTDEVSDSGGSSGETFDSGTGGSGGSESTDGNESGGSPNLQDPGDNNGSGGDIADQAATSDQAGAAPI